VADKIYTTREYNKFRLTPEQNRKLKVNDVIKIAESMEEKSLLPEFPIIVTRDFRVIDGQHRLHAAEIAKVPVYYIVSDNMTMDDVASAQALTTPWTLADYLHYYCSSGASVHRANYLQMQEFVNKWGVSESTALRLGAMGANTSQEFKTGRLNFGNGPHANEVMRAAEDFRPNNEHAWFEFWDASYFLAALSNLMLTVDPRTRDKIYDHNRMMHKVRLAPNLLHKCSTTADYQRMLVEIYNRNSKLGSGDLPWPSGR
jgi:hypothetical protein